jgi:hypothetical protein
VPDISDLELVEPEDEVKGVSQRVRCRGLLDGVYHSLTCAQQDSEHQAKRGHTVFCGSCDSVTWYG